MDLAERFDREFRAIARIVKLRDQSNYLKGPLIQSLGENFFDIIKKCKPAANKFIDAIIF